MPEHDPQENAPAGLEPGGDGPAAEGAEAPPDGQAALEAGAEGASQVPPYLMWLDGYPLLQGLLTAGVVVLVAAVLYLLTRRYLLGLIGRVASRVPNWWLTVVREHHVLERLVPLVPAVVIHQGARFILHLPEVWQNLIQRLAVATIVLVVARGLGALLTAANAIYLRYPISRGRPIKGYLQVIKILVYSVAVILILAALMDQSPAIFLGGIGAMSAIVLLIFRETILSFVAGVQLVNNDLVRVGDWIDMPQFDADGDVIDISLNVVKVQNWDRTVTVIPTHKFLEHSFRNWRSMHESGGRRIKRAVHVDMTTIRFLTQEEIRRFSRFLLLSDYIERKWRELESYNREHCPAEAADIIANARHLTNVGTFRAYISEYLRQHPKIHRQLTFLIRQLAPTPHGLPIEIYVFTNDTLWANYEGIQADIFDHILAVVPEFGLRIFQEPAGHDLVSLGRMLRPDGPGPPVASPSRIEPGPRPDDGTRDRSARDDD